MKINGKEIKGIIFDLDGTLLDSCGMWHQIDVNFFKKHNLSLPDDYAKQIAHLGLTKAATYTKTRFNLKESEEDIIKEWNDEAIYEYTNNVKIKPYVIEMLDKFKKEGIKLSVATANSREYYYPCLVNNNIVDYFDVIHDVSKLKNGKDNPEIYLYVCDKLGLKPEEVAVFEDIPTCLNTAKEAGFITVGVDDIHEEHYKEEKIKLSDLFIESFDYFL